MSGETTVGSNRRRANGLVALGCGVRHAVERESDRVLVLDGEADLGRTTRAGLARRLGDAGKERVGRGAVQVAVHLDAAGLLGLNILAERDGDATLRGASGVDH